MKILITGSTGQLGIELVKKLENYKMEEFINVIKPSRSELDLLNPKQCEAYIKDLAPDILINLAAYTAVEKAENDIENARIINALALRSFANSIKLSGGHIIQISTDYVFNGKQKSPYKTFHHRDPLCIYGKTKVEGEIFLEKILTETNQFSIIRTSWLVGPWRNNFVKTILKKLREKENDEPLKIVFDQLGCLTTTESLSNLILLLIKKKVNNESLPSHIHWCSSGQTNWHEIALSIKKISKELNFINSERSILPINSNQYKSLCPRPKYSLLDITSTEKFFNYKSNPWQKDLKNLIKTIQKNELL